MFGVFYVISHVDSAGSEYAGVNMGNMKRIVWVDLISALLWLASALFSTTMCCSGLRAKVRGKREQWRKKREEKKMRKSGAAGAKTVDEMERGTVRE